VALERFMGDPPLDAVVARFGGSRSVYLMLASPYDTSTSRDIVIVARVRHRRHLPQPAGLRALAHLLSP